ncbi:MAG: hypothetical protein R3E77_16230 [Steroidobacteraceae bacterium]
MNTKTINFGEVVLSFLAAVIITFASGISFVNATAVSHWAAAGDDAVVVVSSESKAGDSAVRAG